MATTVQAYAGAPYNAIDSEVFKWALVQNETGDTLVLPSLADRSVHIFGTFGAGGSVVIEGSNEGADGGTPANFKTLNDTFGNQLSKTGGALCAITEMVRCIRPRVVGGDGTTAITVLLLAKR